MQAKWVPVVTQKLIDIHVSVGRLSRFLDLPEVRPTPPTPPALPAYERWRNAEPLEDEDAPLLELRGAAFTWNEAQADAEASKARHATCRLI